jgi:hypothetical protein
VHTPTARRKCACPAAPRRLTPRRPQNSRAEPQGATNARRFTSCAPFTRRAGRLKPTRSAPARVGQLRRQKWHPRRTAPWRLAPLRPAPRDAAPTPEQPRRAARPRVSRAQPAPARCTRPESQRTGLRAAGASAHTPTARRRLAPLRPAPSDDAPTPEQPRRAAGTLRGAPHLSRAARTTRNRRGARAKVCSVSPPVPRHQQMAPDRLCMTWKTRRTAITRAAASARARVTRRAARSLPAAAPSDEDDLDAGTRRGRGAAPGAAPGAGSVSEVLVRC